jgi:O-acetyl-ADP-ribose deacetylase
MLGMRIEVVLGDITTMNAEVLVTAANSALASGGGVDGAIHRAPSLSTGAFGFPLLQACQISVIALRSADTTVDRCTLVAFDSRAQRFWERTLGAAC